MICIFLHCWDSPDVIPFVVNLLKQLGFRRCVSESAKSAQIHGHDAIHNCFPRCLLRIGSNFSAAHFVAFLYFFYDLLKSMELIKQPHGGHNGNSHRLIHPPPLVRYNPIGLAPCQCVLLLSQSPRVCTTRFPR